ncbi:uncharacterized protein LOC135942880 [Cloeon dipterum]|uniref:uncharacterized protein LOC135942880 n=1 Tax=Cloeon dipterum TaxID=197152 RepID=UPI00322093AF
MRLGLFVLLCLAVCTARKSRSDVYYPAPYFDEGENLSIQNCGNNETALYQNQWIVDVKNIRNKDDWCDNFIAISQQTILELGYCNFNKRDSTDLRVFPNNCSTPESPETEEECRRLSVKVLDVIEIARNPDAGYKWAIKIMITEKMPSEVTPICLFNRDNAMDSQLQSESPYFEWSPWETLNPPVPTNVTSQNKCSTALNRFDLSSLRIFRIPIQNILCVEENRDDYFYLINFYKGRFFLRGLKEETLNRFYFDILPYIDEIAMHAKDIFALRPIPETKQQRGFSVPENLSFQNCGRKPTSRRRKRGNGDSSSELHSNSRIFGENIAQTGDHPWHVYIENKVTGEALGGTLISPTVILTAAHCIYGTKAEDFIVSLGVYDKRQRRAPGVQRRKVSSLITHPKYDSAQFISDIGLMILSKKVKISDNIRPICLWNDDTDSNLNRVAGTKAMAVGFGLVDNHTRRDELQEVRLPIRAHKECYLSKRRFFGKYLRPGDNFCAGYTNGTTICNGYSGGSLSVEKNDRWFIRGIVSFGMSKKVMFEGNETSLCHPNQYSLLADVASYMDWIVGNTPDLSFRN